MSRLKSWLPIIAAVVFLVFAAVFWLTDEGSSDVAADREARPTTSARATPTATATPTPTPTPTPTRTPTQPSTQPSSSPVSPVDPVDPVDPESGLRWIDEADLPPEAWDTLQLIDDGGPYPYHEDDGTFGNFEGVLPDRERGYYREYTVETPGLSHRGARRIVTGDSGEFYWTDDHYQSFDRIRR